MKCVRESFAFGVTVALIAVAQSAHAIYGRSEFEPMWGRSGTLQVAALVAVLLGSLGAICCLSGQRLFLVSLSLFQAVTSGLAVALAMYAASRVLQSISYYPELWFVPWAVLLVLSVLAPAAFRKRGVSSAEG